MSNPFTDIHTAIWTMLEAHTLGDGTGFADLVEERNRLKYAVTAQDAIALYEGGFPDSQPRVAVIQAGLKPGDRRASNCTFCTLIWKVLVATGDQRLGSFFGVQFAVLRAMLRWDEYLKDTLTWKSEPYVFDLDPLEAEDTLDFGQLNEVIKLSEGIAGWASAWTGVADCHFNHATLIGT